MEQVLEALGEAYLESLRVALVAEGLGDSELYKNISYTVSEDTITFTLPEYSVYVDSGRKQGLRPPPTLVLIDWLKKKGVTGNLNRIAFAVGNSIAKKGIKPRPFFQEAENNLDITIAELQLESYISTYL